MFLFARNRLHTDAYTYAPYFFLLLFFINLLLFIYSKRTLYGSDIYYTAVSSFLVAERNIKADKLGEALKAAEFDKHAIGERATIREEKRRAIINPVELSE